MKSGLYALLALSLICNVALLGSRLRRVAHDAEVVSAEASTPRPGLPLDGSTAEAASGASMNGEMAATSPVSSAAPPGSFWAQLDQNDLRRTVSQLRAAGTPEADVRAIIDALVCGKFKARYDAVSLGDAAQPYWKPRSSYSTLRFVEMRAITRETADLVTSLVGDEPLDPLTAYHHRTRFGPLPDAKLNAVNRIESDYSELSMQAYAARVGMGMQMPWEREQQAFIQAEKRRDLEAALTPKELETFDLYTSSAASTLRSRLDGFEPTEAEFRALYALQSGAEDSNGQVRTGALGGTTMSGPRTDDGGQREKIKDVLGETRYADYERVTDPAYQGARQVAKRLKLPAASVEATYALSRDISSRAESLRNDTTISGAEKSASLAALAAEATQQLTLLLTPQGVAAYRQRARWLQSLETTRSSP